MANLEAEPLPQPIVTSQPALRLVKDALNPPLEVLPLILAHEGYIWSAEKCKVEDGKIVLEWLDEDELFALENLADDYSEYSLPEQPDLDGTHYLSLRRDSPSGVAHHMELRRIEEIDDSPRRFEHPCVTDQRERIALSGLLEYLKTYQKVAD